MTLSGKIAVVTGASRGIGAAVAIELARRGAHVVIIARTQGVARHGLRMFPIVLPSFPTISAQIIAVLAKRVIKGFIGRIFWFRFSTVSRELVLNIPAAGFLAAAGISVLSAMTGVSCLRGNSRSVRALGGARCG